MPANLAIFVVAFCLFLDGQANLDAVASHNGFHEAQIVQSGVGQNRTGVWLDKETRSE